MRRFFLLLILWALSLAPAATAQETPKANVDPPVAKTETKKWEFGVIITAVGGPVGGLSGTFPVPRDWPEQQVKVVSEDFSPTVRGHAYRELDGLKQMLFEIPHLAANDKATCLVTMEVTRTALPLPADPTKYTIPKLPPKDSKKSLGPSPFIETTNAKFKTLAKELTTGKETPWAQVEALYDGVRERIKVQPDSNAAPKGALGAIRDGSADRYDMTAAFVALCRAHKVPARMVRVFDGCGAEFYLEDAAGKGQWFPCEVNGEKQFGSVNHFRPIIQKGDNYKVPERKEPLRFVPETVTGKAELLKGGAGRPQVEFRRRLVTTP